MVPSDNDIRKMIEHVCHGSWMKHNLIVFGKLIQPSYDIHFTILNPDYKVNVFLRYQKIHWDSVDILSSSSIDGIIGSVFREWIMRKTMIQKANTEPDYANWLVKNQVDGITYIEDPSEKMIRLHNLKWKL